MAGASGLPSSGVSVHLDALRSELWIVPWCEVEGCPCQDIWAQRTDGGGPDCAQLLCDGPWGTRLLDHIFSGG